MENIYPIFDTTLQREDKEKLLGQNGIVVWMVGLSGSGKSTVAQALENSLYNKGYLTQLLDGDNLRTGVNNNLGFSEEARTENIRRAAEVAKLFANCGIITICSLISPTRAIRDMAGSIIGTGQYFEVYADCPLEICEQRDVKGLYSRARKGEIKDFTGIDAPFDPPQTPFKALKTGEKSLQECHDELLAALLPRISRG